MHVSKKFIFECSNNKKKKKEKLDKEKDEVNKKNFLKF